MFKIKSKGVLILILAGLVQVSCQLPDDIQRELNQNLAEQARIQAMRQKHQQQIQNRVGNQHQKSPVAKGQTHDPNNYSYQQVSPPIQYSYYQPYGDAAQPASNPNPSSSPNPNQRSSSAQAAQNPVNFDLNNLNFDLPQPQAQVAAARQPEPAQQQQYTPSFTGAGGLPVLKPIGQPEAGFAPPGAAPLAPQARVQQGPPLTEADFKDITGGENYGAPGSSDFGLGGSGSGGGNGNGNQRAGSDTDEQLREFGMPVERPASANRRTQSSSPMGVPDFGAFGSLADANPNQRQSGPRGGDSDGFGNLEGLAGDRGQGGVPSGSSDFDFAGQPSSARADQTSGTSAGGAPGSLQSLLGASFPGLGGGGADGFARGSSNPQQQRQDDGSMDIADLGDKSDQFSGADLGGFEQPSPQSDQDFNYAAPSNQQPSSVPYPDGNPQPVGTLWALTQPQSLSQTRYNPLPDKGTYHDYPAYQSGGQASNSVSQVVDSTPAARRPGPGRYSTPATEALSFEHRASSFDYSRAPGIGSAESTNNDLEDDSDFD